MVVAMMKRWMVVVTGVMLAIAGTSAASDDLRLVEAVKHQNAAATRLLLEQDIDVNTAESDGVTALHWAAHWNDADTASLLIRAGAAVGAANDLGVTPLSLACGNGSAALVATLLAVGADANATTWSGETVLMTCARTGNVAAVTALLARDADVHAAEAERGQTALMWAAAENHAEVVAALIAGGADVHARTTGGNAYLRAGITSADYTPILFAARIGAIDAVRVLLDHGADVNDVALDGSTPLLVATHQGRWELAHVLLACGADPNLGGGAGFLPLQWASGMFDNGIAGAIGSKPEKYQRLGSKGTGKLALVKDLLAHGADPNLRLGRKPSPAGNQPGATAFLLAAQAGERAIMQALLEADADPQLTTDDNTTPLMAAAGYGRRPYPPHNSTTEGAALEAVELALESGNDINAATDDGETALHWAAHWGKDSMVQWLVDQGARVNAVNRLGQTPLAIANGTQRPGGDFYSWPNLQVLLRSLGGIVPEAEIEGPIAIFVEGPACPDRRLALGRPEDFSGFFTAGHTEFMVTTDADTEYPNGSCADLAVGMTIRVTGPRDVDGDGSIVATQVQLVLEERSTTSASIR